MSVSGWVGIAVVAGGLAATNPTVEEVEMDLRQKIIMSIGSTQLSQNAGLGEAVVTGMCKLSLEECYKLLRATMNLQMHDYFVAKAVVVRAIDGTPTNCIGAVKRLWCPKFLNSPD